MGEIDNMIIRSLREIGCDIEEDVTSLSSFSVELVVEAVAKCVMTIQESFLSKDAIPYKLPQNMAARVRICDSLAAKVSCIDTKNSLRKPGYQTLLYPSEVELRPLFLLLIEKLPKEDKIDDTSESSKSLLNKSVAVILSASLRKPWLPHYCHKEDLKFAGQTPYNSIKLDVPSKRKITEDHESYCKNYQKSVIEQAKNSENILPAILSYNAKLLYSQPINVSERLHWISLKQKENSFKSANDDLSLSIKTLYDTVTPKSDEVISPSIQEVSVNKLESSSPVTLLADKEISEQKESTFETEMEQISKECEILRLSVEKEQNEVEKLKAKFAQIALIKQTEEQELSVLEEQKKMIARSYDLLNDSDKNIEKLEQVIETKRCKLINLAKEWEERRRPLIKNYREQKEKNCSKAKVDEIQLLREKQRELDQEFKNKEQQYVQLVNKIQKVSKDTNRSACTQRILEIINNIRKQKAEIEKVIEDTREIKKEINNLTGRLERSYAVATELCQHPTTSNLLRKLHSSFNLLIDAVKKTGAIIREIRDLQEQIDNESAKNVEANLARITADLQQVKQESEDLTAQLAMENVDTSS